MPELSIQKLNVAQIKASSGAEFLSESDTAAIFQPRNRSTGEAVYTTPGSFIFVVPEGVIKLSVLAVGAGGGGNYTWANRGGGGGALAWRDNIEVTPGDTISITVPGRTPQGTTGGAAVVGAYIIANGGSGQVANSFQAGGTFSGGNGGNGGNSHTSAAGGGGGAGGYTGNGGNGSYGASITGNFNGSGGGGGGGGGYDSSTYAFGGGGGVGINGEGVSGIWGSLPSQTATPQNNGNSFYSDLRYAGPAGSDGENGAPNSNSSITSNKGRTQYHAEGGDYGGGGGGGGTSVTNNSLFCRGGQGAVRIAWSTNNDFSIAKG